MLLDFLCFSIVQGDCSIHVDIWSLPSESGLCSYHCHGYLLPGSRDIEARIRGDLQLSHWTHSFDHDSILSATTVSGVSDFSPTVFEFLTGETTVPRVLSPFKSHIIGKFRGVGSGLKRYLSG